MMCTNALNSRGKAAVPPMSGIAKLSTREKTEMGYSFMLRSPNQTANQIRRSDKDDQSNIFVTVFFVT